MQDVATAKRLDILLRSKSVPSSSKSTHYLQDSEVPMTDDTSYKLFMMQDKTRDPILITLQVPKIATG